MNYRFVYVLLALTSVIQSAPVMAQPGGMGVAVPPDVRFADAPQLGEMIPDLTIVDDDGNPANLRELATGQYTVLTLGCLT